MEILFLRFIFRLFYIILYHLIIFFMKLFNTPVDKIKTIVANGGSITYCDVLEDRRKYDKMFNTKEEKEEFYILTV